jgi:hypothetical protein
MIVYRSRKTRVKQPPTRPLADARPLYIAPDADTRVDLDGPALRVTREATAEQLFPLRRLSRVYSARRVAWTSEALLACAHIGVSVVFVDDNGSVAARLLGRPHQPDDLYRRMVEFLLLPQAEGMYQHWLGNARRRAAHWAGLKLGAPAALRDPRHCREWVNRQAFRHAGRKAAERSWQWLRALAFGWMQAHLQDLGFGTASELGQVGAPVLARDLSDVFMWYLEPARIGWLRSRHLAALEKGVAPPVPAHREMVALFESNAARAAVRGREITSNLHRWLIHET